MIDSGVELECNLNEDGVNIKVKLTKEVVLTLLTMIQLSFVAQPALAHLTQLKKSSAIIVK